MKTFKHIALAFTALLLVTSCAIDEMWEGMDTQDEEKVLTFKPKFEDFEAVTKAIGDGSKVDKLLVQAYPDGEDAPEFSAEYDISAGSRVENIKIPFFYSKTYKVYFWAYDSEGDAYEYTTDAEGNILLNKPIKVKYPELAELAYNALEHLDAFYSVQTVNLSDDVAETTDISLIRPFAQVNLGALADDFTNADVTKAQFTVKAVPTDFTLAKDKVTTSTTVSDQVFTFTDFTLADNEGSISYENTDYRYVGTTYIFVPSGAIKISVDVSLYAGDKPLKEQSNLEISIDPNKRTNLIFKDIAPKWDNTLADNKDDVPTTETDGWIHISKPEELAALLIYGGAEEKKYHICGNLDMSAMPEEIAATIGYPEGGFKNITIDAGIYDDHNVTGSPVGGGSYMLKNINNLKAFFGTASNITVQNIILDKVIVSGNTHVGVLVNTLSGENTFKNVTIQNSSATTTTGAAGGMIGYIVRASEKDRAETLSVTIDGCKVNNTSASGTLAEGKFVGLLSGYDNGEQLVFTSTCAAEGTSVNDWTSPYEEGNEGAWLASNNYTSYDGWLGDEVYYRGKVYFGGTDEATNRFCRKWDGTTTIEPLLANATYDAGTTAGTNRFVVYSAFDLAGVRKKTASPAAIYLKADVDMNGQGADGKFNVPSNFTQSASTSTDDNVFDPFNYVTTLDGYRDASTNNSIYNLSIAQIEQERAAFILYASGTTVHKNINFRNCQTVAVHKPVTTDAKAYGAILVSNVDATYTMENVHAYDCKVFALQKVGTLGARISGTSTLKNNSVNNCYVENYECTISERFQSGSKTMAGFTIDNVYADFYPYGEVGGMYGFIQGNSSLTDCKVNGSTVNALGQDDKMAEIKGSGWKGAIAVAGIKALGYYKVPGRHVSTLIGNIRATGTVTLTGCTVDANTKCTNRHDKHNATYHYIGQAYIVKFLDSEGSVTVDGIKLTLADCNKDTKL